ncbi:MAG: DUF418 domain-containing protein [Sulfurimonas sp.]|nr:DUF418 domain-containing protein [Sulfurimonas sp.]
MSHNVSPIVKKSRVEILDVVRGFAIFGIIIANIQSWSGYKFVPYEVLETLPYYDYNTTLKYLFMFFIDTKFYTLFSLLFGIGFYLQFDRQRDNQDTFMKTYRKRLGFLIMFGAIHSFFWSGDILLIYGAVGLVFVMFRNLKPYLMFKLSILFYFIWLAYDIIFALFYPEVMNYPSGAYKTYPDISPAELTAIFQNGTFAEVLQTNWHNLYYRYIDLVPSGRLTKVLALFMLGFYLMSINYFTTYARSFKLFILFFTLGVALTYLSYEIGGSMSQFSHDLKNVTYKAFAVSGQIFLAMSYIHILAILDEKAFFKKFFHLFAYVGRMSFTSYLTHTIFGFLIFYPFFGGLFGTMGILEITILAIVLYAIQILFSYVWLKYFSFGPLEWLWRCLTYSKLFPILKTK